MLFKPAASAVPRSRRPKEGRLLRLVGVPRPISILVDIHSTSVVACTAATDQVPAARLQHKQWAQALTSFVVSRDQVWDASTRNSQSQQHQWQGLPSMSPVLSRQPHTFNTCDSAQSAMLPAKHSLCELGGSLADITSNPRPSEDKDEATAARRAVLLRGLTALAIATAEQGLALPAQASKLVSLPNGSSVEAFEHAMSLVIVSVRGSVPAQWVLDFRQVLGKYAGFSLDQRGQLAEIFQELSGDKPDDKRSSSKADVVTVGDAWLAQAIQQGRVRPIPGAKHARWWSHLSTRWRALVQRDRDGLPDPHGQVFAAPYRWGGTLVAYRRDRLLRRGGQPIVDWVDLLQPQLAGRVALFDSSREFVGIALKTLGLSYNTSAAELRKVLGARGEERLAERCVALRRQVKLFSSRDHIRALEAGDVWAVVGWSQDIVGVGERSQQLEVVCPASGTALWADLWVVPSGARGGHLQQGPSPLLPAWLEFCLMPARIPSLPGLKGGASPLLLPDTSHTSTHQHATHHQPPSEAHLTDPAGPVSTAIARAAHFWRRHVAGHGGSTDAGSAPDDTALPACGGVPPAAAAVTQAGRLNNANYYLPPRLALDRSEFLLPLDEETLQLYHRVLASQ